MNALIALVQSAASIVKKSVENRALSQDVQVVEDINEYVKYVPIVSSVVQILIIATKLAEMYTEMKRREEAWPLIYARVEDIREIALKQIIMIMELDSPCNTSLPQSQRLRACRTDCGKSQRI